MDGGEQMNQEIKNRFMFSRVHSRLKLFSGD
jgi:hypothetical protein